MSEETAASAIEIVSYFIRNPGAADSLHGIARWRLLEETVWRRVEEVRRALDWLVDQGVVLRETQPFGGSLYRLDPGKLNQARALVLAASAESRTWIRNL